MAPYTAVIRWTGPDPLIEVETRHPGFAEPEEAALFANALTVISPQELRVGPDGMVLVYDNGKLATLPAEDVTALVIAPTLAQNDFFIAEDDDYSRLPSPVLHSCCSAHGVYQVAQYGVLGPEGKPVSVVVEIDEEEHLRVTVEETYELSPEDKTMFAIGTMPRA